MAILQLQIEEEIKKVINPVLTEIQTEIQTIKCLLAEKNTTRLLRREELAKFLHVRKETIDKWVREGKLPPHDLRIGRIRYWDRQKLFTYLQKNG
ncbi:MAG: helix-turn-helix domain-containing protein [Desulfonauticus sp.]|nr:helix-turn-helix domain-containing protein [Desulfonauticus sp.]